MQHSITAAALSTSFLLNHIPPTAPSWTHWLQDLRSHAIAWVWVVSQKVWKIKPRLVEFWQCTGLQHLSENAIVFPLLPGSAEAQVIWGGNFIGDISAKKYQNPFTCVKVIASQRWDVFETWCICSAWKLLNRCNHIVWPIEFYQASRRYELAYNGSLLVSITGVGYLFLRQPLNLSLFGYILAAALTGRNHAAMCINLVHTVIRNSMRVRLLLGYGSNCHRTESDHIILCRITRCFKGHQTFFVRPLISTINNLTSCTRFAQSVYILDYRQQPVALALSHTFILLFSRFPAALALFLPIPSQKRLNRSRCSLTCWVGWLHGTCITWECRRFTGRGSFGGVWWTENHCKT